MALFKRNGNKDQAAEDLAEGQAGDQVEDTSQDAPGANAEDASGEDSVPEQAPTSPKRFGKPKRKPKRDLRGVVRIEELEQALADQDLDDIDPDAVVSMYMPKRRMERIGAALLRMDKLQKALVVLALAFGVLFALSFMQENMGNFTINLNRLELFRRGVAIADNGDFNNATARLAADALDNAPISLLRTCPTIWTTSTAATTAKTTWRTPSISATPARPIWATAPSSRWSAPARAWRRPRA